MLFASGNVVHNLRRVEWDNPGGSPMALRFSQYIAEAVLSRQDEKVLHYKQAQDAAYAVPTLDHFMPLVYALGASQGEKPQLYNHLCNMGSMDMTGYTFGLENRKPRNPAKWCAIIKLIAAGPAVFPGSCVFLKEANPMNNEVLESIQLRRSIRSYRPDPVPKELLEAVIKAGLYAPSGKGSQETIILAITNPAMVKRLSKLNCEIGGWKPDFDPFYGAPAVLVVLAKKDRPTRLTMAPW